MLDLFHNRKIKIILIFLTALILCSSIMIEEDYSMQIEQCKVMLQKYESDGNKIESARCLNKLAYLYWQINDIDNAVENYERSVKLNDELGNKNALRIIYNYLGQIYSEKGEYSLAVDAFEKCLALNIASGNTSEAASVYLNIAVVLHAMTHYNESNSRAKKGLEKALEANNLRIVKSCYLILAENYEKIGNNKEASDFYEKYNAVSKYLQEKEMEAMAERTEEYQKEVQTKQNQLSNTLDTLGEVMQLNREIQLQNELLNREFQLKELEIQQQEAQMNAREKVRRLQIVGLSIVLFLTVFFVALVYWQFSQKKRANFLLQGQNQEIERQKNEIEEQRDVANRQKKKVTDSIYYARRIQHAVLPPEEILENGFNDSFILYRPKDIVSGDFYWVTRKDDIFIVAAADCTGHGVPGAFMSMLGVAFLNEIVNKIAINKHISALFADDILNQLRDMVITSLHQSGNLNEPKDGMDIALCIIDHENRKIQFAGANNPLYLVRDGELMQFAPDKMPVSYHQRKNISFKRHEIELKPDDRLYLFSDGFVDQFGGEKGMKFLATQFRELILKVHKNTMKEQRQLFETAFDEWRGSNTQLDDVLVIGIKYEPLKKSVEKGSSPDWSEKTVLIAEDTDVNYYLMVEVLRKTQVKIIRVRDGREAVDFIKNNTADLVLMDINMPRMNGYEATREIKEINPDIPIIVQTALHFDDESEEAFKVGADDFIAKPINIKTFISKLEQFLK